MRFWGTSAPRRKVGVGGLAVRWAQSRGEWLGSRRTFFEGREPGARVEVEGARDVRGGLRVFGVGARRVEAAEGGGRRAVEGLGGFLNGEVVGVGRDGGGMSGGAGLSGFRLALVVGGGGGGIIAVFWAVEASLRFLSSP